MPRVRLTDQLLKSLLNNPPTRRIEYQDTYLRGLGVRASPERTVGFFIRRRLRDRTRVRVAIGRYPDVSLSDARKKATSIAGLVAEGQDPRRPQGILFGDLARSYFEKVHTKKSAELWQEERRVYERDIAPAWAELPAHQIEPIDVLSLLTEIFDRVRASGRRNARGTIAIYTRKLIRRIFKHGLILKAVSHNPVDLIPPDELKAARSQPRRRVLSDSEIRTIWPVWDSAGDTGAAFQVILLSGQRPHSEIARLQWKDIEDPAAEDGSWCDIPITKSRRPNRIFLPPFVFNLLPQRTRSQWVFKKPAQPDSRVDLQGAMRNMRAQCGIHDWTPHDLRRTAATGWARLGTEKHIIDILLNHGPRSVADRHYIWFKYQSQVREAALRWSDHISDLVSNLGD